jgi:DNA-binding NarL/FixJ family response regulator
VISKLLIVDDHAPTRQWLRSQLTGFAAEIFEAGEGSEAVQQYAEHQPELVLMDVEMKPMNGLRATEMICAKHPGARVVMFSTHNDPSISEAATGAGALMFVQKEDLWKVVEILEGVTPSLTGVQ